jgi:hypothetical protein
MTKLSSSKILGLALGCAALVLGAIYASADSKHSERNEFSAHGGTSFVLHPTSNPGVYSHTVDGVVRVSGLGDCTFHAEVLVTYIPSSGTYVFADNAGDQTFTFTTVNGDMLYASVAGGGTPNPANPQLVIDFYYHLTFTGGTGKFANAHGKAELVDGLAVFGNGGAGLGADDAPGGPPVFPPAADLVSPASGDFTGKACWIIFGNLDY